MNDINELAAALAKAQGEIMPAPKDADNPYFKSKYASLPAVREAMREAFARHGLSVVQIPQIADGRLQLHTLLLHSSGQSLDCGTLAADVDLSKPQAIGSAVTYFRRYALAAISQTVADDDDDANEATSHGKPQQRQQAKQPPPKAEPPCTAEDVADIQRQINEAATLAALKAILNGTPYLYLKAHGPEAEYEKTSRLAKAKYTLLSTEGQTNAASDPLVPGREQATPVEGAENGA